eukprot:PhF_6_TR10964/c0_g1_i1/m.17680/K09458/fabF; 3-oxoacyl-[acyl-carrier-protein] synthase II
MIFKPKPQLPVRRHVVVTGMGMVSSLGNSVQQNWNAFVKGERGIRPLSAHINSQLPPSKSPLQAAEVLNKDTEFAVTTREPLYTKYALKAVEEALQDAGLNTFDADRTGVNVGVGMPSLVDIGDTAEKLKSDSHKISPFFVPKTLGNMVSGVISIKYGLRGCAHSVVSACATGTHCIGEGYRMIERGDLDVVIVGATESCVNPIGLIGFLRMKALGSDSRPFDMARDGFVMGEGCGILVLESADHAASRGRRPYAEIRGYGYSADGNNLVLPHPEGLGGRLCMQRALEDAGVTMREVGYVSAHATGTPKGDTIELNAIEQLCARTGRDSPVVVGSSKGSIGHLLGAAGSAELVIAITALHKKVIPPNAGLTNPLPHDVSLVKLNQEVIPWNTDSYPYLLKNSFGFGGTNASLVVGPA